MNSLEMNNMRLLIVDDEKIALDAMSHILSQQFSHLSIETARNGRDALVKLQATRPQILITDIRMPGMSGLELIKEARRFDEHLHIVIVSAFDQFDYAKEAFKYRVDDYVLKPLSKQKVIDVVSKVIHHIKENQLKLNHTLESIDRLYRSMHMIENHFFYLVANGITIDQQRLDSFRDLLSLPLVKGVMVVAQSVPLPSDASWKQAAEYNNRLADARQDFEIQLKRFYSGLTSEIMGSGDHFFAFFDLSEEANLGGSEGAFDFFETLYNRILKHFGIKLRLAYSQVVLVEELHIASTVCLNALALSNRNVVGPDDMGPAINDLGFEAWLVQLDTMYEALSLLDDRWMESLNTIEEGYKRLISDTTWAQMAMDALEQAYVRLGLLWDQGLSVNGHFTRRGLFSQFKRANLHFRMDLFKQLGYDIALEGNKETDKDLSEPVAYALKRIEIDYAKELSLEEVAKNAHVSVPYLSKIFKDETGTTFKSRLTEVRLSIGKNLLRQGDMSVKDISYTIGYNDPNYFVRLFKKETGFTPGEYQRVMVANNENE